MSSQPRPTRRTFLTGAGASLAAIRLGQGGGDEPKLTHGPFFTARNDNTVRVWARASKAGEYTLYGSETESELIVPARASIENDLTLHWTLHSREVGISLLYVKCGDTTLWSPDEFLPPGDGPLVIGSCADDRKFPDQPVWQRIRECGAGAVVLIGDTPYIDTTDLEVQRCRYR